MKITNVHGIPLPLVQAMENDPYDDGGSDISVTRLIDSPRIRVLLKEHDAEAEVDASERLWALAGQALHLMLERANKTGVVEERFHTQIRGWDVSGQVDWLVDGCIQDWKWTSVWAYIWKSQYKKWEEQLNCLAGLARLNGHEVDRLQINPVFRDFQRNEAKRKADYPPIAAMEISFPVWEQAHVMSYMDERVCLHQEAEKALPLCSDEDRWWNEKYKRYNRCAEFCAVSKFCTQFRGEEPSRDK